MKKVIMMLVIVFSLVGGNVWGEDNDNKISIIASEFELSYICIDGLAFLRAENTHYSTALVQVMDRNGKPKICVN